MENELRWRSPDARGARTEEEQCTGGESDEGLGGPDRDRGARGGRGTPAHGAGATARWLRRWGLSAAQEAIRRRGATRHRRVIRRPEAIRRKGATRHRRVIRRPEATRRKGATRHRRVIRRPEATRRKGATRHRRVIRRPGATRRPPGYPPAGSQPPAQQPFAYPQKGQSPEQVSADQRQCGEWATQQTGFNPNAPAAGTARRARPRHPFRLFLFQGIRLQRIRRRIGCGSGAPGGTERKALGRHALRPAAVWPAAGWPTAGCSAAAGTEPPAGSGLQPGARLVPDRTGLHRALGRPLRSPTEQNGGLTWRPTGRGVLARDAGRSRLATGSGVGKEPGSWP